MPKSSAYDLHRVEPRDLNGQPYTPAKRRPWLSAELRADIANQMACEPCEVEYRLDKREQMDRFIEARVDYERGLRDLDISLSSLAREHDEGRVGDTPVADECAAYTSRVERAA